MKGGTKRSSLGQGPACFQDVGRAIWLVEKQAIGNTSGMVGRIARGVHNSNIGPRGAKCLRYSHPLPPPFKWTSVKRTSIGVLALHNTAACSAVAASRTKSRGFPRTVRCLVARRIRPRQQGRSGDPNGWLGPTRQYSLFYQADGLVCTGAISLSKALGVLSAPRASDGNNPAAVRFRTVKMFSRTIVRSLRPVGV